MSDDKSTTDKKRWADKEIAVLGAEIQVLKKGMEEQKVMDTKIFDHVSDMNIHLAEMNGSIKRKVEQEACHEAQKETNRTITKIQISLAKNQMRWAIVTIGAIAIMNWLLRRI